MTSDVRPGDLVIEKITPWINNNVLGIVIAVHRIKDCKGFLSSYSYAYALTSAENVAYVLFSGQGVKGPFLPNQLSRVGSTA